MGAKGSLRCSPRGQVLWNLKGQRAITACGANPPLISPGIAHPCLFKQHQEYSEFVKWRGYGLSWRGQVPVPGLFSTLPWMCGWFNMPCWPARASLRPSHNSAWKSGYSGPCCMERTFWLLLDPSGSLEVIHAVDPSCYLRVTAKLLS